MFNIYIYIREGRGLWPCLTPPNELYIILMLLTHGGVHTRREGVVATPNPLPTSYI
jgi:hypothetical protein